MIGSYLAAAVPERQARQERDELVAELAEKLENWSARFEYDFVGLNQTFTLPAPAGGLLTSDQFTGNTRNIQLVNARLNYKSAAGDDERRPP